MTDLRNHAMKTSSELIQLGPLEQLLAGRIVRRLIQLAAGLVIYGLSMAMMIRGNLGLAPWDALHIGVTRHLPLSFGAVVVGISVVVLLLWLPLREIPGLGTVANALIIGTVAELALQYSDSPANIAERIALTFGGILLCGVGSAMYIGAQLGRGPRDGLMTGLHRVTGYSLRAVRTALEISVLAIGIALGGTALFGPGTVLFALCIGPLTQAMLPRMLVTLERPVS